MLQWHSSGGVCEDSAVFVRSEEPGEKWLKTQYINKSLPAPDEYPVRVFVNITYSSLACSVRMCDSDFELRIAHNDTSRYTIMPMSNSPDIKDSDTKHFYFDLTASESGFSLALYINLSHDRGVCINVSRVLVYRHECPEQTVGLTRYPATQAPVNGRESVRPYCANNSHPLNSNSFVCTAEGEWMNDWTECECDIGYYRNGNKCEGMCNNSG